MAILKFDRNLTGCATTSITIENDTNSYCNVLNIDTAETRLFPVSKKGEIRLPEDWINVRLFYSYDNIVLKTTQGVKQPKNKKWYQQFDRKRKF